MKNKQTAIGLLVVLCLIFSLSACGRQVSNVADSAANAISAAGRSIGQLLEGDVTGEIGKDYSTRWFSFNVKSVARVDAYAGYTPAEGSILVDVLVSETCIFEEAIPMGTNDFYMDDSSYPEYIYPLLPFDDTMMPEEFELGVDETAEYHILYEIPAEFSDLRLMYTEIDVDDNTHATFTIPLAL